MSYFIGIDVGTSATKSVLFDETGKIIFQTAASMSSFSLKTVGFSNDLMIGKCYR